MLTRALALLVPVGLLLAACGAEETADSAADAADNGAPASAATEPLATIAPTTAGESSSTTPLPTTAPSFETAPTTSNVVAPTTSTVVAPTTSTVVAPTVSNVPADCRRLEDFDEPGDWFIVNDGVMGGRSQGQAAIEDSTLRFSGMVVTAGGGFTSIRLGLDEGALAGSESIRVRARPDARMYGLTLEDDQAINGRRISHGATLSTPAEVDDDGFVIVEVPHTALEPTVFGELVLAEPFRPDTASEIGIIISDGVDGEFALDVDWIDVCG